MERSSDMRCSGTHTIRVAAPVQQCQRFFTAAGEELWVDGWQPRYVYPPDGRTEAGMVFCTGSGDELTFWTMTDFNTAAGYARFVRVTPQSRIAIVEVRCTDVDGVATDVAVTYTVTALDPSRIDVLGPFRGAAFKAMIEDWRAKIEACLPMLLQADIR